jgi:hypothetical protein
VQKHPKAFAKQSLPSFRCHRLPCLRLPWLACLASLPCLPLHCCHPYLLHACFACLLSLCAPIACLHTCTKRTSHDTHHAPDIHTLAGAMRTLGTTHTLTLTQTHNPDGCCYGIPRWSGWGGAQTQESEANSQNHNQGCRSAKGAGKGTSCYCPQQPH